LCCIASWGRLRGIRAHHANALTLSPISPERGGAIYISDAVRFRPTGRETSGARCMEGLSVKSGSGAQRLARCWLGMVCVSAALCHSAPANAEDSLEIAKQAQNPIASLISVPFQNNATFGVGENSRIQDSLLIEPVVPFRLTSDWNLITRAIVPLIDQPTLAPGLGNVGGLGDVQLSLYMSPVEPSRGLIWGLGPSSPPIGERLRVISGRYRQVVVAARFCTLAAGP
jgi:hypothetical protein